MFMSTQSNEQQVKSMFAALAVGSLLAAVAIYLLRGWLGIPDDTARLVSTAFVGLAVVDGLVIYLWDRIFKRSK
jgi:phosphate/sulfate permease